MGSLLFALWCSYATYKAFHSLHICGYVHEKCIYYNHVESHIAWHRIWVPLEPVKSMCYWRGERQRRNIQTLAWSYAVVKVAVRPKACSGVSGCVGLETLSPHVSNVELAVCFLFGNTKSVFSPITSTTTPQIDQPLSVTHDKVLRGVTQNNTVQLSMGSPPGKQTCLINGSY